MEHVKVFVNEIIEEDNGMKGGIAASDTSVSKNLKNVFGEMTQGIFTTIANPPHPDGFYFHARFHQLVVLFMWQPVLGITLKFTDFNGNWDNALDHYTVLVDKEWTEQDRNKIMDIFQDIQSNPSNETVKMVIISLYL